jgi:hypothetical protein
MYKCMVDVDASMWLWKSVVLLNIYCVFNVAYIIVREVNVYFCCSDMDCKRKDCDTCRFWLCHHECSQTVEAIDSNNVTRWSDL